MLFCSVVAVFGNFTFANTIRQALFHIYEISLHNLYSHLKAGQLCAVRPTFFNLEKSLKEEELGHSCLLSDGCPDFLTTPLAAEMSLRADGYIFTGETPSGEVDSFTDEQIFEMARKADK